MVKASIFDRCGADYLQVGPENGLLSVRIAPKIKWAWKINPQKMGISKGAQTESIRIETRIEVQAGSFTSKPRGRQGYCKKMEGAEWNDFLAGVFPLPKMGSVSSG